MHWLLGSKCAACSWRCCCHCWSGWRPPRPRPHPAPLRPPPASLPRRATAGTRPPPSPSHRRKRGMAYPWPAARRSAWRTPSARGSRSSSPAASPTATTSTPTRRQTSQRTPAPTPSRGPPASPPAHPPRRTAVRGGRGRGCSAGTRWCSTTPRKSCRGPRTTRRPEAAPAPTSTPPDSPGLPPCLA